MKPMGAEELLTKLKQNGKINNFFPANHLFSACNGM